MGIGWLIGFCMGIVGIISRFTYIHMVSEYNYWLLLFGFLLVSFGGPHGK